MVERTAPPQRPRLVAPPDDRRVRTMENTVVSQQLRDEYPRPPIKAACLACRVTQEDIDRPYSRVIVSPVGMAHFASEDRTQCGKDATGEHWWWPL